LDTLRHGEFSSKCGQDPGADFSITRRPVSARQLSDNLALPGLAQPLTYEEQHEVFFTFQVNVVRDAQSVNARKRMRDKRQKLRAGGGLLTFRLLGSCFGPEDPKRRARDKMSLTVEGVVDGGMDVEKTLCGSGRLEPLHLALSSPHTLGRCGAKVDPSVVVQFSNSGMATAPIAQAQRSLRPASRNGRLR
jgi:hypothetical protein